MKKTLLIFAFSLLFFSQSNAQFTLKGEFRPRFEYRGGYGKILSEDEKPIFFIPTRSSPAACW